MSRRNTRSKNKRSRPESAEDAASQVLRKIHITGEITRDDISQLYLITKPVCEGCRGNSKDNPNCFCGLIPSSNGTRKTGLWQKMSDIIGALGPNPCADLRPSPDTPAGLTNLGATCYANSILQCLYMNAAFRAGIFALEMDVLRQHPVLDQLTRLFAQLHSSSMAFIDSAPFITTLDLDNGVQQDSHEFLTLFLSLLERSFRHSKLPRLQNIVQDLFRGRVSNVTRCSVCRRESEASLKVEDFYELELNIKGLNNIYESLEDYLSVEELQGENQYFCESCGMRVNATRFIKLRELPVILNFQLKRYVFLPKTTTKKKITSVFSFPRELSMGQLMSSPSDATFIYELSAILIHKGTTVNSGHYVAHIWDDNTGQWWEFDDERVSKLGKHPFSQGPSNSSLKSCPPVQMDHVERPQTISNVSHTSIAGLSSPDSNKPAGGEGMFSSRDAYMLMYARKKAKDENENTQGGSAMNSKSIGGSLPVHLSEQMQNCNTSYAKACEEFRLKKDHQVNYINERRQEVKSILSESPVSSNDGPYFWISTEWLRQWADAMTPLCIGNRAIECVHGKLPASKIHSAKRVSVNSWEKLFSKYGGGPALSNEDCCMECIKLAAKQAISADNYRDRRALLKQIAEDALAGSCPEENLYYVSRTWLVSWFRRKSIDAPCDADAGPTASLRCPHGDLLPEHASGAKRILVPESLWLFIHENATIVRPNDSVGCSAFPSDSEPCAICNVELTELSCLEDGLRETKIKQRQNHEKLFLGKCIALSSGTKYFLLPSSWLMKWRAYVTTTGKNISSSVEPESLEVCLESVVCKKHSRLIQRPLDLIYRRGVITQKSSTEVGLTLISENDWHLFCEEWNIRESKGIVAEIQFSTVFSDDYGGSSEEAPILDLDMEPSNNEAEGALETRKPFVKTIPELCEICIGEKESCVLMRRLHYHDEDICVVLVSGKEPPKSLLEASGTIPKLDRRTSKRSRKTLAGNTVTLKVSCSTSVYQLKMMIWESFGVVKENQTLHKGSVEIEDDLATLADKNIFPGDVLWFSDSGIHENRDIVDELSDEKTGLNHAEEGFRGTLLSSDILALMHIVGRNQLHLADAFLHCCRSKDLEYLCATVLVKFWAWQSLLVLPVAVLLDDILEKGIWTCSFCPRTGR